MAEHLNIKEVKELFQEAKNKRQPHEFEIREAFEFSKAARNFDQHGNQKNQAPNRTRQYDATIVRGARNLVTNTIRLLVPQNKRWATIDFRTKELKDTFGGQFTDAIAKGNDKLFRHFADSNFYLAITEGMYDSVIAGTMCIMMIDEVAKPLNYLAIPVDELYFLEDYDEKVDVVFRSHELTARQLVNRFGEDNILKKVKDMMMFKTSDCSIQMQGIRT